MSYAWMLGAMLAGLWTGLLLPLFARSLTKRREQQTVKEAERGQEQLLQEWLYGENQQ